MVPYDSDSVSSFTFSSRLQTLVDLNSHFSPAIVESVGKCISEPISEGRCHKQGQDIRSNVDDTTVLVVLNAYKVCPPGPSLTSEETVRDWVRSMLGRAESHHDQAPCARPNQFFSETT